MKLRFIFHNPKGERGIGKFIVGYTWLLGLFYNWKVLKYNFSHEEIWVPSNVFNDFEYIPVGKKRAYFAGQCFSSTTRGGAKGVRFAPASEVLKHPGRWSYIEVEVDDARFEVIVEGAKRLVGGGYDYGYIISFLQPFLVQKDSNWACSEICDWLKCLGTIPTEKTKGASKVLLPVLAQHWFKWPLQTLREFGFFTRRHFRVSPRRSAYLLARIFGEPKAV